MHTTRYRILQSSNLRILKNDFSHKKTYRSHNEIILEQICEMEKILENEKLEDCSPIWMQLGFEVQSKALEATI